jgi:ligand-binding SRPBCC domain-containing protein
VCQAWEREALAADALGIRTVILRIGVVLDRDGGPLARMLPAFRAGLGGRIGSGRQWMSWIHRSDLVDLVAFALAHDDLRGPVNAVAPLPVTNAAFTATLARRLGRPAVVPVPAVALRVALGEMASVVLAGQRVQPAVAERLGFAFRHPDLAAALADVGGDAAQVLEMEQWVPRPPAEVFAFFADPHNLERITPPFLNFRILAVSTPTLQSGTRIDYRLSLHGVPVRWQSLIHEWQPATSFVDVQTRGPYRRWEHTHSFVPSDGGTIIHDRVVYELPFGGLGQLAAGAWVARDLARIFAFRRATIRDQFA